MAHTTRTTKEDSHLFQERVDELLLLEQRIDRRAEKFVALTSDYQAKSQQALNQLLGKVSGIDESLAKMNAASDSIEAYVAQCAKQGWRTTLLFCGAVMASVLIVAGTVWWSHHTRSNLADAKAELARLHTTLKHTPVIGHYHGKDYVRVVPGSETSFTRGDGHEVPERYAEVWHVR